MRHPGRTLVLAVALGLVLARAGAAEVLVEYSFDDGQVETGPDTFAVFEHARGSVDLDWTQRFSGYRSVAIRDVAGDGDFPELQGYFALRRTGHVYAHFALLVTDPGEPLNAALAGPAGFRLGPDGIAFWLQVRDGWLLHVSDSIPRRLLRPEPFTWYRVDLDYDVDRGRYDLALAREREPAPLLDLRDQPAAASQPGSGVNTFSFIGDTGSDDSNAAYFVDDVVIGTDAAVRQRPFIAPGRRKLFLDRFAALHAALGERTACPPATSPADFGIDRATARGLAARGRLPDLRGLVGGTPLAALAGDRPPLAPRERRILEAGVAWSLGCRALEAGDPEQALGHFARAARSVPGAPLYALGRVIALVAAGRQGEADALWARLEGRWRDDPRYPVVMALLGRARGALPEAEAWLREPAEAAAQGPDDSRVGRAVSEQYFFLLVWNDRLADAERYAEALARRERAAGRSAALWRERAGDAAAYAGRVDAALAHYDRALEAAPARTSVLLKRADLHFVRGEDELERRDRERVYGSLRGRPD